MKKQSFNKNNQKIFDHILYIFIWLLIEIITHAICYGGGTGLQVILANHGWWVFTNLNLPVDTIIQKWGASAMPFWNFIGGLYDIITIGFSVFIYVVLGRKYFTYWIKTLLLINFISFFIFILFPVYYVKPNNSFNNLNFYDYGCFGELPSFHNLNIQIFLFPIIISKIKKEKYNLQNKILIWIFLALVLFLSCATFLGRIVQQIHYFIDGIVSLGLCIVICLGFMNCKYMWKDSFVKIRKKILLSKFSLIWTIFLIAITLGAFCLRYSIESSFHQ